MNAIHKRRLYVISLFVVGVGIAAGLILYALKQNINVFLTPSQLASTPTENYYNFRLGGVVKTGSVKRENHPLGVRFIVTDFKSEIPVYYAGVLPDLFQEGKGVIAEGRIDTTHTFVATMVLAKHDENYMPKNVYQALRKQQ